MTERIHLLDVNVLVALALTTHQRHRAAHDFINSVRSWATTPITEVGLVRLLMNPAVGDVSGRLALDVLRGMRQATGWSFLADTGTLADCGVSTVTLVGHAQVTDFHLAGLARQHGATLATFDRRLWDALSPDDRVAVHVLE